MWLPIASYASLLIALLSIASSFRGVAADGPNFRLEAVYQGETPLIPRYLEPVSGTFTARYGFSGILFNVDAYPQGVLRVLFDRPDNLAFLSPLNVSCETGTGLWHFRVANFRGVPNVKVDGFHATKDDTSGYGKAFVYEDSPAGRWVALTTEDGLVIRWFNAEGPPPADHAEVLLVWHPV